MFLEKATFPVKLPHPLKAYDPIDCNLSGKINSCCKLLQLLKA